MITRQTKLQLIVFAVVAFFGLVYAGGNYAGLGKLVPGYDKGYLVKADFSDSGGIFQGAEVTYRGVAVGKVEKLNLITGGVELGLRLRPGTKVPTPVKAFVDNRSAVGEQFVDLQPQTDSGTPLRGGDLIPVSMTSIPIQPTQLVVNLDRLVRSVSTADITVVLDELGKAFGGSGGDLQRLIDASNQLTAAATQNLPQTLKLIKDSKPVLDTQRAVAGSFRSYTASLASLTAQLRASDPDFRTLFTAGTDSAKATTSLLEANRTSLPVLLDNLTTFAQIQAVRIPALRQILVTYPNVAAGGFTVTPGDGTAHFGLAMTMAPPACSAGYQTTAKRDPSNVAARPSNTRAYCSSPSSTGTNIRGAGNAPRADGLRPYPQDGGGVNSSPAARAASLYAGTTATNGYATVLADYDPSTGHAITSDGARYTVGNNAAAVSVLGSAAWEWLLLDPLHRS